MSGRSVPASTDGLPKQFVTSLRILFDILDEERTGFVRLGDIESRWHEEGVRGLPSGVIDSLRKVAPKTGRLNFDTFVSGLKLSLLRNNQTTPVFGKEHKSVSKDKPNFVPSKKGVQQNENVKPTDSQHRQTTVTNAQLNSRSNSNRQLPQTSNTATVRPNNVLQSQNIELRNQIYNRDQIQQSNIRQHSKVDPPGIRDRENDKVIENRNNVQYVRQTDENPIRRKDEHVQKPRPKSVEPQRMREFSFVPARQADIPPGRPERPPPYRSLEHQDSSGFGRPDRPPPYRKPLDKEFPPAVPPRSVQRRVMQELKQWQKEQNMGTASQKKMHTVHSDSKLVEKSHGNDIYVNIDQIRQQAAIFKKSPPSNPSKGTTTVRRQNSRRHTLSSGIDYNVIHRMKQLEKEKDELLQGLEVVDRAREWYLTQIASLTDKQHTVDKVSCSDMTLQANQEKYNFIRSRISEVNLNLRSLMETTEKGFPAHMNLAMRSKPVPVDNSSKWLKEQNKQLTKEVGDKSEKITQLEKEKATLIRDLFEARSRHKTNYDDTTFM